MRKSTQKEVKTKSIKVAYSSRINQNSKLYMGESMYTTPVPKIQMEGKWLEKLGFHIGDKLNVEYGDGAIRITLEEPKEQPQTTAMSLTYTVRKEQPGVAAESPAYMERKAQ